MQTRNRILETALTLFNDQSTARVTTNHIAAAMSISPGNLYYHFRNKQEIIRSLFDLLVAEFGEIWVQVRPGPEILAQFLRAFADGFDLNWKYRFLYRELVALTQQDAALGQRFQEVFGARSVLINQLADQARSAGLMRFPDDPAHFAEVNQLAWLVNQFWLSFLDLGETPATPEKLRDGARLMVRLLDPYLTAKGRREAKRALAEPAPRPCGQTR